MHRLPVVAACLIALASPAAADALDRKVDALMARMTLSEKLGQLTLASIANPFDYDAVATSRFGNIMNFGTAPEFAKVLAAWNKSRLKIPMLHGTDVIYGHSTLFVPPLAQAASFDLELNRAAFEIQARETAAIGTNWIFAPMVDLTRDSRWGRVVEGAGEDVHLASCLAGARVRGLRDGGVVVSAKHFAAYGYGEGGRDYEAVEMGEPYLRDHVLPPFRAAIAAGAQTVMASFNTLNGVPATANRHLLQDILRRDMGFRGAVVSDWAAIFQLANHGVAKTPRDLMLAAFKAGVDLDMASYLFMQEMPAALDKGLISRAEIDRSVRRVLRLKFEAGLERRMHIDAGEAAKALDALAPRGREIAIELGRRTTVLLRNENDRLPLEKVGRIALVGGLADSPLTHLGPHPGTSEMVDVVTLRRAITERAQKAGATVDFYEACGLCRFNSDEDEAAMAEAVKGAAAADTILVMAGETYDESGEAASRADLALPSPQVRLIKALAATGKPVVVLITGGRPQVVESVVDDVDAIVMAWLPGAFGSIGTAEILFGDVSPSARLPISWPRSAGQLPMSYDRLPTGRPAIYDEKWTNKYLDYGWAPRWPFGFGLSYGATTLSEPRLDRTRLTTRDTLNVTVTVENTSSRPLRETVQIYVHDVVASRSRPARQLKGWTQVDLAPGEKRDVTVPIRVATLGFHVDDGSYVVERGTFQVIAATSADTDIDPDDDEQATFEVTDDLRLPPIEAPIPCVEPSPAKARAARR